MNKYLFLIACLLPLSLSHASTGKWETVEASYEVPAPAELAAYAKFPGFEVKRRFRRGRTEIEYMLPVELTGRPVQIQLRDVDGSGVKFAGPVSDMTCDGADCAVRYPGLKLDAQEVQDSLAAKGVQGEELAARMQVFARFDGGDPAGVIHFTK